jgi:hypothetical protein
MYYTCFHRVGAGYWISSLAGAWIHRNQHVDARVHQCRPIVLLMCSWCVVSSLHPRVVSASCLGMAMSHDSSDVTTYKYCTWGSQ